MCRPPLEIAGVSLTPRVLWEAYKLADKKADYWAANIQKYPCWLINLKNA